ncbi:MAG: insulinase family protein [Ferruginibacter sp.]|nr:insulinase family protein [Ferruginibacter sp.]
MLKGKLLIILMGLATMVSAQKVTFQEYTLSNGLHVILHQDNSAPVVAVSVMYHVGSKDENPERTGFAHFFEHLLFEGSENIKRGEFMKLVSSNGGQNNANTTQDRTFYYEIFPSNQLETGLWLESERMMHPVINEIGVSTQNEVVKEEKRMRVDNQPYGNLFSEIFSRLFTNHPYRWAPIGSMAHLDSAKLDEFIDFNKKFYTTGNAVLVIAGDIEIPKTKKLVEDYFGPITAGQAAAKKTYKELPITKEIVDTAYDANIQIPAIVTAYRTPGMTDKESMALQMASDVLSQGSSSRMYKKMVDDKKDALMVASFNYALEDYGAYLTFAIPSGDAKLSSLLADMDEEIAKLQTELISEKEFTKIQNQFENNYVGANEKVLGIAENLANGYTFYKNTNQINQELDEMRAVTREDIMAVAKKYLNPNQRLVLYYLPKKS